MAILAEEPTEVGLKKALETVEAYHSRLLAIKVLDPACGSGNFLYVAYDMLRSLELEVFQMLEDLSAGRGGPQRRLGLNTVVVTPEQFLGLEIDKWAASIAELVLWIGHLQWFHRLNPGQLPPQPVLSRYNTIEERDALLEHEGEIPTDEMRWDGRTKIQDPLTCRLIPDRTALVRVMRYIKPRAATWPKADFVVGNPPFLGSGERMRRDLGSGYVDALHAAYPARCAALACTDCAR